jgi:hypothetical protein
MREGAVPPSRRVLQVLRAVVLTGAAVRAVVGVTARDVKDALRRRHPALDILGRGPGQWTCIEEWHSIDLLAFNSWAGNGGPRYGRVGYEVKVGRGDYRRELLRPGKRAGAVAFCHEFYFAVPKGLLKPDEIAWKPPVELRDFSAYTRERCPGYYGEKCRPTLLRGEWSSSRRRRGPSRKGPHSVTFGSASSARYSLSWKYRYDVVCPTCEGKGYLRLSLAERIAPTLWVPEDVGLIEVDGGGCHVTKPAPRRKPVGLGGALEPLTDQFVASLVRHVSYRPDPRHLHARSA